MNSVAHINFAGKKIISPAIVRISFAPVFESLRKMSLDTDETIAAFANSRLAYLEQFPVLEEGFTDSALLKKYEEPIAKLLRTLFPDALQTNEIKGVSAPFEFNPFFISTRFRNILNAAGDDYSISVMNFTEDEIYIFICCVILSGVYKYAIDLSTIFRLSIPDIKNTTERVYRVAFNAEMISIVATDKAPPITADDYALLVDHFDDIAIWKEKFPPGSYILSGIGIINLMDVTVDQSIAGITSNLLAKSGTALEQIATHIRTIFRKPDLHVGYISFEDDSFSVPPGKKNFSLLLKNRNDMPCKSALCVESYDQLIDNKKPLVITDTSKFNEHSNSKLSEILISQGLGSYIIIPLVYEDDFLGFMELGSEKKYELSLASLKKLDDVLPILSMALSHFKTESWNEMDAVIQQEFTQIHKSVKWRFEEEAKKYIHQKRLGEDAVLKDLDFPNIYPLFGQLDIKGSSTTRNEVIQKDIISQLTLIKNIVSRAHHKSPLPLYEELSFRIDHFLAQLGDGVLAGSEHDILYFIRTEINPVFDHLKKADKTLAVSIKKYEEQLDPVLKVIYHERRKFDESISVINKLLSEHLDKRQEEAQQMFPHYFERYKTDGVAYNIYIGASIAHGKVFDKIYVQNLRLWQLMIMSELENEFNSIKKNLPEALEIASLIMVYSDPLTIHFRVDEKKFDVKGAYNARYEIIKSRIDKAVVKGTQERLTLPGKLAIVYSNEQDAIEYTRYIDFLTEKGYFKKDSLEKLFVEDLQGITGLQALRIEINYSTTFRHNRKMNVSQLMESLGEN